MRYLFARPAITLLTFAIGVALTSSYFLLRQRGNAAPPCNPSEAKASPSSPKQPRVKDETPNKPSPERFIKLGELPEHDADETERFRLTFESETVGWLVNGSKLWRTTDGGAHWELLYSKGKVALFDPEHIDQIKFINANDGWMLVNERLQRTHDGGRTWLPLTLPKVEGKFVTVDFLPDGKVGWLGGRVCAPLRAGEGAANRFYCPEKSAYFAAVYMTRDGGHTWQRQPITRRTGDIYYLRMLNARSGLAIGQAGTFRYQNGRWLDAESQVPANDAMEWLPGERSLQVAIGMPTYSAINFHFIDDKHGWLSNSNGYLGRTNDGGRTWMDIARCTVEGKHLDPPYFANFNIAMDGYGVALDTDGGLQETEDGGTTWNRLTGQGTFNDMFALDTVRVWLIAADGVYRLKDSTETP